jgi:CubicO group peptidase (beta-lactamase class C family)
MPETTARTSQFSPELNFVPIEGRDQLEVVLRRLHWAYTVFQGGTVEEHTELHRSYDKLLETNPIAASDPQPFERSAFSLPRTIRFEGSEQHGIDPGDFDLDEFLAEANVVGFAAVHEGRLVHESYYRGNDERTAWMTNSASKVIVAMLLTIARDEGAIVGFEQPLSDYWPELAETAWAETRIIDCLRMESGMLWDEEDLDLFRDCPWTRVLHSVAFGAAEDRLLEMERAHPPGEFLNYSSLDTEMLGGILIRATGLGIAEYLRDRIWTPAGMEHDAYWVADPTGREMASSGLCASLRDYARLGWILANDGRLGDRQIVPQSYVDELATPDERLFSLPGADAWVLVPWMQSFISADPRDAVGDFMACGSYGQIIYANPAMRTAIAVQSVYRDIAVEYADMYRQFIACRQIAEALGNA